MDLVLWHLSAASGRRFKGPLIFRGRRRARSTTPVMGRPRAPAASLAQKTAAPSCACPIPSGGERRELAHRAIVLRMLSQDIAGLAEEAMRILPWVVAALGVSADVSPARSQFLPDWDANAFCQIQSTAYQGGTARLLTDLCLGSERDSLAEMRRIWFDIPDTIRNYCSRASQTGPNQGSYSALRGCVISGLSTSADQRLPTPTPPPTEPQWVLRTPDGVTPFNSLNECAAARAKSTTAWAICTNR